MPETQTHALIDCNDAFFFWDVFVRTFRKPFQIHDLSLPYLVYPDGEDSVFECMLVLAIACLWKTRVLDQTDEGRMSAWEYFRRKGMTIAEALGKACSDKSEDWQRVSQQLIMCRGT